MGFLKATELLGPTSMESVHRAAHAMFGPCPERRGEFDALFRAHFHGEVVALRKDSGDQEEPTQRSSDRIDAIVADGSAPESGRAAARDEAFFSRRLDASALESLKTLARKLDASLPRRRAFRRSPGKRRAVVDLRRSLASVARNDGDIPRPVYSVRQTRPRRLVLLIDVSGSMKQYTDDYLRFAYTLKRNAPELEVFTLGTRLTCVSACLETPNQQLALANVSALVPDWDGGTRLGPTFAALLGTPRYVNFLRGAAVLVLSDALETGDPKELQHSVRRLRRLAWRLSWATPLAADPAFRPETAALKSILPDLDDLVNGGDLASLVSFVLTLSRRAVTRPATRSSRAPHTTRAPR
jgi:uncharacterized protein with von Willebrand factor type A (vWA) domain